MLAPQCLPVLALARAFNSPEIVSGEQKQSAKRYLRAEGVPLNVKRVRWTGQTSAHRRAGRKINVPGFLTGHDFSRADKANQINRALQAAEKPGFRVGRRFISGVKAMKSMRPLGPEACFPSGSPKSWSFSAASLAPRGTLASPAAPVWRFFSAVPKGGKIVKRRSKPD